MFMPATTRLRGTQKLSNNDDWDALSSSSGTSSEYSLNANKPASANRKLGKAISISLTFSLAALSASVAGVFTAVGTTYALTNRYEASYDEHFGNAAYLAMSNTAKMEENFKLNQNENIGGGDGQWPKVAWLMSFPNSGTSFTLHLTRAASNCTTATNYALEGDIRDQPSKPAIRSSENGPYLELIPNVTTNVPHYILTKTHCGGFCASCPPLNYIETPRSFQISCQSGRRAIVTKKGLKLRLVTYNKGLVKKAVHLVRNPLDNIVARFHLEYGRYKRMNNVTWIANYPYNRTGFQKWCRSADANSELARMRWVDGRLAAALTNVPCHAEFFRYVQWHNLAFSVSRDMGLPTIIIHYNEYRDDFEGTLTRLLNFLELPRVGRGEEFSSGKEYKDYYTPEQRQAVGGLVKELATAETWKQLQRYSFS